MAERYCSNCGDELSEDARFCSNCGRPVHETTRVPTPEAEEKAWITAEQKHVGSGAHLIANLFGVQSAECRAVMTSP